MVAANRIGLQNGKMQFRYQKKTRHSGPLPAFNDKTLKGVLLLLCLLALTSFVISQDHPRASSHPFPDRPRAAAAPILIIHGLCPPAAAKAKDKECARPITRAEFGSLITALDPKMPESNRLALATEYVRLLTLAQEAERLKLDQ